jgi:tyrosyl-tRNA synthetase
MRLARELSLCITMPMPLKRAEENFVNTFAKGGVPDDIKEVEVEINTLLVDVLLKEGLVESKSEFRRLESEGAITFVDSGEKIAGHEAKIDQDAILKIGKRRFIKIKVRK